MDEREQRGIELASRGGFREEGGRWIVPSQQGEGFWQRLVAAVRPSKEEIAPKDTSQGYVEKETKRQASRDESPDLSIAP